MSDELNPYETPKTIEQSTEVRQLKPTLNQPMVNTKFFGVLSRVLLGVFFVQCLIIAIWDLKLANEYETTEEYEGLAFLDFDQMMALDDSYLVLFIGAILSVAFWKYKSMQNAWAMMRSGMRPTVSPGWAVAWYIIPIASMWKPFTAMSEINENSTDDPKKLKFWLGFWWLFWLVGSVMGRVGNNEEGYADAGDLQYEAVNLLIMGLAAVFLERIICTITGEQMAELEKRRKRVKQAQEDVEVSGGSSVDPPNLNT